MSTPESSGSHSSYDSLPNEELSSDHFPLFETENDIKLNDWYTYLWCFSQISLKRTIESIQLDNQDWLDELTKEIQKFKAIGIRLDKRKNTPEDNASIRQEISIFIAEFGFQKPEVTTIRRFDKDEDLVKGLIHDLKNAHTPMYFSLYVHQKDPSSSNLQEHLIHGFEKLHTYSQHAKEVLLAIKGGENKELPLEEINLFQLFEAIEQDLLSNLHAEDPTKSVHLKGLHEVRLFIETHSNLVFFGRVIDLRGLLTNIARNCVEQYREVRDTKFPNRAEDPRTMSLHIELQSLTLALTILDRATGYSEKILESGFKSGQSEKKFGQGVGLADYLQRLSSSGIKMQLANYNFDTGHSGDEAIGTGSITILLIPVKEKQ